MVTGGFRTQAVMEAALASGEVDLIGLARPLAIEPDLPNRLLQGSDVSSSVHPISTGIEAVDKLFPLEITWYTQQLHRMGNRQDPALDLGAWSAILFTLKDLGRHGLRRVRAK
jgi:hypothetical protein